MLKQLELEEAQERSAGYTVDGLKWAAGSKSWFDQVQNVLIAGTEGVIELPQAKSVVYRAPDWLVEIIPRAKGFALRLAADASSTWSTLRSRQSRHACSSSERISL